MPKNIQMVGVLYYIRKEGFFRGEGSGVTEC